MAFIELKLLRERNRMLKHTGPEGRNYQRILEVYCIRKSREIRRRWSQGSGYPKIACRKIVDSRGTQRQALENLAQKTKFPQSPYFEKTSAHVNKVP